MHFSINKPIDHLRSKEAYNNIKAMASTYEPLIPSTTTTTKNTFFSCKSISLTLSIAATLILLIATFITYHQSPSTNLSNPTHVPFQLCTQSPNPASCHAIVSDAIATVQSQQTEPNTTRILHTLIQQSLDQLDNTLVHVTSINHKVNYDMSSQLQSALTDCIQLLDISRDHLLYSATALAAGAYTDARTWLSAVLTNHVTCLDGSDNHPEIKGQLDSLVSLASAALSVLNDVSSSESDDDDDVTESIVKFPSWVTVKDRMLLEASAASGIQANVTVAKDGSGDYSTLQDAVNSAPNKTKTRYVIYVRNGTYAENVNVGKTKTNVMIVGDGMNSTVITGSLNVVDNSTTFNSATLAAVGEGFILQDICIENTAGPQKHQAVALRVGADKSVINRCQLNGYQDTLYTHSLRQFYRDSNISGTVDFIFGNAAVVFQNCNLIARLPMSNQQNLVTAQGRIDPNQNTGTSIQSCQVIPSPDLLPMEASIPTYLGRPWKNFSRTVYMQSYIDSHINPKGWLEWDGDFALDTLYYGEFANTGPGAGLAGRVNWTGYHVITDPKVAMNFTVGAFIQGTEWLQSTGVAFSEGLV